VILLTLISLDGRISGQDGAIDWHVVGPEIHQSFNDQERTVDTFLDGPRMSEGMAAFCPTADDDPESSPQMVGYAQLAPPMPKLVFSNTPEHAGCSTTVVAGDRLADTVAELRARPATGTSSAVPTLPPPLCGSISSTSTGCHQSCRPQGPVFGELEMPLGLSLVEARTFDDTVVLVCYAHRRRHERRASVQLCTAR
jgi:hypothetical protein